METFLTVNNLVEALQCSRPWIYKLVREKKIPYYHIEKSLRFHPAEIQQWLEGKRNGEYHIESSRGKHRGRPRKKGARGEAPPPGDASSMGENNRAPDRET